MQKSILNFSENVLSREEMKQVKGGVTCTIRLTAGFEDGTGSTTLTGPCSGSTIDVCHSYAANQCSFYINQVGYSGCSYQCY